MPASSCVRQATRASSATRRRVCSPISSSSTWSPKRRRARSRPRKPPSAPRSGLSDTTRYKLHKLLDNKNALGLLFMLPAGALLLVFLTYPLGLGTWLGFTDAKIGRTGEWIGLENFQFLIGDSVARLSLFNTLFYTVVASILKFVL